MYAVYIIVTSFSVSHLHAKLLDNVLFIFFTLVSKQEIRKWKIQTRKFIQLSLN